MKENKTYVEEGDRSFYDFRYEDKDNYKVASGLTPDIIRQISREKNDPEWMLEFRLRSLDLFSKIEMPNWGPSIKGLNMDNIVTYVRPNTERMLDYIRPDFVHVLYGGTIVETGDATLAKQIDERGFDWIEDKYKA